jgi:hypothetical protein
MTLHGGAASLFTTLVIAAGGWLYLGNPGFQLYRTFDNPDGRYRVEIWREPQAFAMPGQSGDAPGVARLAGRSGHILAEVPVEWSNSSRTWIGRTATPTSS